MKSVLSPDAAETRSYWIAEIAKLSGVFGDDTARLEAELHDDVVKRGSQYLMDHLRLCGDIPEQYSHDSSEEKLYSKYTDCLLSQTYKHIGLKSIVLTERSDAADVEAFAEAYSFVADAKAFRLSRTAKNAKDFKIPAMNVWKRGKPYAMVVCPIYQLPTKSSQIYLQSTTLNVCILSYSHLSLIISAFENIDKEISQVILAKIFKAVEMVNPSKDAGSYWSAINRTILEAHPKIKDLWLIEKMAALQGLETAKLLALNFLSSERERIMRMTHDEALKELVRIQRIDSRIRTISDVSNNNLMGVL